VLALGGLYMVGRSRPAGVVDGGQSILNPQEVMAQVPPDTQPYIPYSPPPPAKIGVHIAGEVYSPGFHVVPYGSRVNDVVVLAGGLTQYADLLRINLAAFVEDASQIIIPAIGEDLPETAISGSQGLQNQSGVTADGRININLANLTELQTLPGIGAVRAQSIVDFREASGGFNTIEELMNISGIGQAIFDNIRDRVMV